MRLDPNNPPERVVFNGITFRRMGGKRKYYLATYRRTNDRRGAKGLHVAIWEDANGAQAPKGYEVHHKDGDTFNCDPDNLECLPMRVHRSMPKDVDREKVLAHLEGIRPLASQWHKSEEGRKWHRENTAKHLAAARAARLAMQPREGGVCVWCGGDFTHKNSRKKFCSAPCANRASRYETGKTRKVTDIYLKHKNGLQHDG